MELKTRVSSEWISNAERLDVLRKVPVVREYPKYPNLSVQANTSVVIKCLDEPREVEGEKGDYAFLEAELLEEAEVWSKEKANFTADKGTKVTMNMKRHASLWRQFKRLLPCTGKEVVIANLGKRTFKTDKAPKGKATGYDYRVVLLSELQALMKKKK